MTPAKKFWVQSPSLEVFFSFFLLFFEKILRKKLSPKSKKVLLSIDLDLNPRLWSGSLRLYLWAIKNCWRSSQFAITISIIKCISKWSFLFSCSTTLQDCYTTIQYTAAALVVLVLHIALANEIAEMGPQECRIELPYVTQTWQHCRIGWTRLRIECPREYFVLYGTTTYTQRVVSEMTN